MRLSLAFIIAFAAVGAGEIWKFQNIQSVGTLTLKHTKNKMLANANTMLRCYTVAKCITQCLIVEGPEELMVVYVPSTGVCFCGPWIKYTASSTEEYDFILWRPLTSEKNEVSDNMARRVTVWPYLPDCLRLYNSNHTEDAVYTIHPPGTPSSTDAWCDMTNAGWTVVQRRKDGSENFNRSWDEYVAGFGNRTGEYWLGLENMHHLAPEFTILSIQLESFNGNQPQDATLHIGCYIKDSASNYGIYGWQSKSDETCDTSWLSAMSIFSTYDRDNDDNYARNCATELQGGWWFNGRACEDVNLNGEYYQQGQSGNASDGIRWNSCFDKDTPLKSTVMKMRLPQSL